MLSPVASLELGKVHCPINSSLDLLTLINLDT